LLLIEVADTTVRYDRTVKIPLYARHGLPEVWLVDLQQRHVEVYRDPAESNYWQIEVVGSDSLAPSRLPEAVIDIRDLFEGLSCGELKDTDNQTMQFAISLSNEGYPVSLGVTRSQCGWKPGRSGVGGKVARGIFAKD
jgi:hypothetical protein